MVLACGNVGLKETKGSCWNWARVIRKVEKSNFSINIRVRQLKTEVKNHLNYFHKILILVQLVHRNSITLVITFRSFRFRNTLFPHTLCGSVKSSVNFFLFLLLSHTNFSTMIWYFNLLMEIGKSFLLGWKSWKIGLLHPAEL